VREYLVQHPETLVEIEARIREKLLPRKGRVELASDEAGAVARQA
jgi:hypothetical protein